MSQSSTRMLVVSNENVVLANNNCEEIMKAKVSHVRLVYAPAYQILLRSSSLL